MKIFERMIISYDWKFLGSKTVNIMRNVGKFLFIGIGVYGDQKVVPNRHVIKNCIDRFSWQEKRASLKVGRRGGLSK